MVKIQKSNLPLEYTISCEQDYRTGIVLQRLLEDGFHKCYICEDKLPTSVNVEHIVPTSKGGAAYDWGNLLLACAHCNQVKSNKYTQIVNCTEVDPESIFSLKIGCFPVDDIQVDVLKPETDKSISETKELLSAVYNGSSTPMRTVECQHLRRRVFKDYLEFQKLLLLYMDSIPDELRRRYKLEIEMEVNRSASFSAFKRSILKSAISKYPDLADCVDE